MKRKDLIEEWNNFIKAPIPILLSALLISFAIWLFLDKYVYKKTLEDKTSTIELLERQLSIYKEKKYTVGETTYSKLSNNELKEKAQQLFDKLNQTYLEYKSFDTLSHYSNKLSFEKYREISERQSRFGSIMVDNYENNHSVEAVLLREQFLMRLPKEEASSSDISYYQHTTNPIGYKFVLDDFKSLILKLPED